jgi:hypothetical protein
MIESLLKSGDYDIYEQYTIVDFDGYNVLALLVDRNYDNMIIKLFEYLNLFGVEDLKGRYLMRKGDSYMYIYVCISMYVFT